MSYQFIYSQRTPGLFVFILDQSVVMAETNNNSKSLSEQACELMNQLISELAMYSCNGRLIKDWYDVAIIVHGASSQKRPFCHQFCSISDLYNNPVKVEFRIKTIDDGCGNMADVNIRYPIFYESGDNDSFPDLPNAFLICYSLIDEWIKRKEKLDSSLFFPAPIIINITNGEWSYSEVEMQILQDAISRIKSIQLPDGSPLIINCVISLENSINYMSYSFLNEICSSFPREFEERFRCVGYSIPQNCLWVNPKVNTIKELFSRHCFYRNI